MKALIAAVWFFCMTSFIAQAQSTSAPSSAKDQTSQQQSEPAPALGGQQTNVDPAKEVDIRRLLDVMNATAILAQTMQGMETELKPVLSNSLPAGEYREKLINLFFTKVHSRLNSGHLIDLAVPIYDRYLTDDEIKGLIQFYETPLGHKAMSVLPKLSAELQEEGRKWGEKIGRQAMLEVLTENPELEEAMEAARKKSKPE
jgi:uncharacterized protein